MLQNWNLDHSINRALYADSAERLEKSILEHIISAGNPAYIEQFFKIQKAFKQTPSYLRWLAKFYRTMMQKKPGYTPKNPIPAVSEGETPEGYVAAAPGSLNPKQQERVAKHYLFEHAPEGTKESMAAERLASKKERNAANLVKEQLARKEEVSKKYSNLDPSQMAEKSPKAQKLLMDYYKNPSPETEQALFNKYAPAIMRATKKASDKFYNFNRSGKMTQEFIANQQKIFGKKWTMNTFRDELFQDASVAFLDMLTRYDPTQTSVITSIDNFVHNYVSNSIREQMMGTTTRHYRAVFAAVESAMLAMRAEKLPTSKASDVANYINKRGLTNGALLSPKQVEKAMMYYSSSVSIDSYLDDEENGSEEFSLADRLRDPSDNLDRREDKEAASEMLKSIESRLTDLERTVLRLSSGVTGRVLSFDEISYLLPQLGIYTDAQTADIEKTGKFSVAAPEYLRNQIMENVRAKALTEVNNAAEAKPLSPAHDTIRPLNDSDEEKYFTSIINKVLGKGSKYGGVVNRSPLFVFAMRTGRLGGKPASYDEIAPKLLKMGVWTATQQHEINTFSESHEPVRSVHYGNLKKIYFDSRTKIKAQLLKDAANSPAMAPIASKYLEMMEKDPKGDDMYNRIRGGSEDMNMDTGSARKSSVSPHFRKIIRKNWNRIGRAFGEFLKELAG